MRPCRCNEPQPSPFAAHRPYTLAWRDRRRGICRLRFAHTDSSTRRMRDELDIDHWFDCRFRGREALVQTARRWFRPVLAGTGGEGKLMLALSLPVACFTPTASNWPASTATPAGS